MNKFLIFLSITASASSAFSLPLASGKVLIGNASNIAAEQSITGDATINNTGVLVFKSVTTGGTFPKVTFNAKGQVMSGSALTSSDITTGLGYTPASTTANRYLAKANIFVGNESNVAEGRVLSGDATLTSNGTFSLRQVTSGGTFSRVTVDTKGRVISGSDTLIDDQTMQLLQQLIAENQMLKQRVEALEFKVH